MRRIVLLLTQTHTHFEYGSSTRCSTHGAHLRFPLLEKPDGGWLFRCGLHQGGATGSRLSTVVLPSEMPDCHLCAPHSLRLAVCGGAQDRQPCQEKSRLMECTLLLTPHLCHLIWLHLNGYENPILRTAHASALRCAHVRSWQNRPSCSQ